jgi:RNA polymerase sigma factor (sigma-70 family)
MLRTDAAADGRARAANDGAKDEEARLLDRVAQRDMRAFEALYRTYHPRLTRFLMNMTRRRHLVEEILDDTMMVVWDRPDSFGGSSRVSTWIFAIAYRKSLKALRRWDDAVEDPAAASRLSHEPDPEETLRQNQTRALLFDAMGELSAEQRAVVDLAYFGGDGYREIAEVMGCPVDTVKTRMFHARRKLKQWLGGGAAEWL